MAYKLSQSAHQHCSDIRAISVINEQQFVSSSRDMTSIIWEYNESEKKFVVKRTLVGHDHYVSCSCLLPQSEDYPQGLILTGSHDNKICVYDPSKVHPLTRYTGHTNAVSALEGLSTDTFASGSWDSTIKVWRLNSATCIATLETHAASIFGLLLLKSGGLFVSSSADKLINVYKWPGLKLTRSLSGHTDCVRGLAALKENEFLSCSNDGTIRHWNAELGILLEILFTYDSFLYSIVATEDASLIVSCGENNAVIVLDKTYGNSTLKVPALTVWSVGLLPNKDIIAGSSDGFVRIFSADLARQASLTEIKEFEESIKLALDTSSNMVAKKNGVLNDDLKISDLPGPEALTKPGSKDGQLILISENTKAMCYQWSEPVCNWILVGDVTGTNGNPNSLQPTPENNKKVVYEGREYDFVFNIDVKEGNSYLKLPYSIGSNPYEVADDFLTKHNLPLSYRMDIVNFLLENGGSPSDTNGTAVISEKKSSEDTSIGKVAHLTTFPVDQFVIFNAIDFTKARGKLLDFATLTKNSIVDEKWLDGLVNIAKYDVTPTNENLLALKSCLEWPQEYHFPALDLIRMSVTLASPNATLCQKNNIFDLRAIMSYIENTSIPVNSMLTLKILANMLLYKDGQDFANGYKDVIIEAAKYLVIHSNKSLEVSMSTLLLNMIVLQNKQKNVEVLKEFLDVSLDLLETIQNKEGIHRILVGIGTAGSRLDRILINESTLKYLQLLSDSNNAVDNSSIKIKNTATKLLECLLQKFVIKEQMDTGNCNKADLGVGSDEDFVMRNKT